MIGRLLCAWGIHKGGWYIEIGSFAVHHRYVMICKRCGAEDA